MEKTSHHALHSRGFALVVTLTLMVLLSILALGLLSLSSIALRSVNAGAPRQTAQANARLALMLAIAELQTQAGPDTRITARADILDRNNPPVLGVWKSWEGTDHTLTGSAAGRPVSPGNYATEKKNRFLAWLVSGDRTTIPNTASGKGKATLVGTGSLGGGNSDHLPGKYAGVSLRSLGDPVLFLKDSAGVPREMRRSMLDGLSKLNAKSFEAVGDPGIQTRMQQYEMAYRMQSSVPELTDLTGEQDHTYGMYGEDSRKRGTFANSALMARRLLERGVRFVQIFHRGWDQHGDLPRDLASQCKDVDQGCYGLIQDLKQRGMLEDTLVIFGGEFGRTVYSQGTLTETNYGRDHHPRCFSMCMAGGGIKGGQVYGETDEMSYNITENPVHIRDLHATILHALGIDHQRLTYKFQGLDQRLTGVEPAKVVTDLFA